MKFHTFLLICAAFQSYAYKIDRFQFQRLNKYNLLASSEEIEIENEELRKLNEKRSFLLKSIWEKVAFPDVEETEFILSGSIIMS